MATKKLKTVKTNEAKAVKKDLAYRVANNLLTDYDKSVLLPWAEIKAARKTFGGAKDILLAFGEVAKLTSTEKGMLKSKDRSFYEYFKSQVPANKKTGTYSAFRVLQTMRSKKKAEGILKAYKDISKS